MKSIEVSKYTPIREITTWTPRWIILGRVTNKGPVNVFKRPGGASGKVLSLDIMDLQGDSIRAKFWGDAVEKWNDFLEESKVYTFSSGRVQLANKRFNNLSHAYEITFDVDAKIAKADESVTNHTTTNSIPYIRKYNFMTLRDVHNSPKELPFLVDLLVVIKWISPSVEQFVNRTTQNTGVRRIATVVDDTGYQMTLTLFGNSTQLLEESTQEDKLTFGTIIAVQNVQIREFRGRNGSTLHTTHIVVNPDVLESQQLKVWLESTNIDTYPFKMLSDTPMTGDASGGLKNIGGKTDKLLTLADVVTALQKLENCASSNASDLNTELLVVAPVEISKLLYVNRSNEVTLVYPSCPKCNRKVVQSLDSDGYHCESCSVNLNNVNYKFMLAVQLVDASGSRFTARVFNDSASVILGCNANQLEKSVPHRLNASSIPQETRELLEYDALWKKYRVGIRGRREYYGGEDRTNVSITFIEPYDYKSGARKLLESIREQLQNLNGLEQNTIKSPDDSSIQENPFKKVRLL
ncbi:uncharacterized protein LOC128883702 isoform X2 [Hylaeus volcanicus]|uniref:uncharacterized protein LOC128883702 isoform X2 n=1 Tax=Hylaeus volcanicus TaxID=313075 RepID=UPI0023B7ECF0|nr:uncharacterized protein LOC128883702 isoform X2 [Hylaeus volcanicus]